MTRFTVSVGLIALTLLAGTTVSSAEQAAGKSSCPALSLAPLALPAVVEGAAYSYRIPSYGGYQPVTVVVGSGSVPPGILVAPSGEITGVSTASGVFDFTVVASDSCPTGSQKVSQPLKMVVNSGGGQQVQPTVIKQQKLRLKVTSLPGAVVLERGKPASKAVKYQITAQPAETATLLSPGGTFSVAGAVVESVAEPMTMVVINGTGQLSETVIVPNRVLELARREKTKIVYSRSFSGRQTTGVAVVDFTLD